MEIEPSGHSVDVECFASEIEMRHDFAFERVGVDVGKRDASACYELIAVVASAINTILIVREQFNEAVELSRSDFGASTSCKFDFLNKIVPKFGLEVERAEVLDCFRWT